MDSKVESMKSDFADKSFRAHPSIADTNRCVYTQFVRDAKYRA